MIKTIYRNLSDHLFRYFFKQKEYFVQIYKELSGRELSADDIELFNTESVLLKPDLKNDVSFITKDNRFVFLVEHQSSANPNMFIRLLMYYAEILKHHIKEQQLWIYGSKEIPYPKAELYVAYNGDRKIEEEEFTANMGDITVHVRYKNIHFDGLHDKSKGNVLAGYSYFIQQKKHYEKEKGLSPLTAVRQAIKDCKTKGYLKKHINRKEFSTMVEQVYTIEEQMKSREEYGIEQGIERGIEQGIEQGIERGATEKALEVAKRLFRKGMSIDEISEVAELSVDELAAMI